MNNRFRAAWSPNWAAKDQSNPKFKVQRDQIYQWFRPPNLN